MKTAAFGQSFSAALGRIHFYFFCCNFNALGPFRAQASHCNNFFAHCNNFFAPIAMPKTRAPIVLERVVGQHANPILITGGWLPNNLGLVLRDFLTLDSTPCLKVTQQVMDELGGGIKNVRRGIDAIAQMRAKVSKDLILEMMRTEFDVKVGAMKAKMKKRKGGAKEVDDYIVREACKNQEEKIPKVVTFDVPLPMSGGTVTFKAKVQHRANVATEILVDGASVLERLLDLLVAYNAADVERTPIRKRRADVYHADYKQVKFDPRREKPYMWWTDTDGCRHRLYPCSEALRAIDADRASVCEHLIAEVNKRHPDHGCEETSEDDKLAADEGEAAEEAAEENDDEADGDAAEEAD